MSTTPKLGLPLMAGTDLAATIDNTYNGLATIIDGAALYSTATFALRPAANTVPAGTIFRATDFAEHLYVSDGTNWLDLGIRPAIVSSLPGSPVDGQEVYYQADATNGVIWHLRYRSAASGSYKWEYVGGPAMSAEVVTAQSTTSNTFVDLATVGPTITVPLSGDFEVSFSTGVSASDPGAVSVAPKFGSTSESNGDKVSWTTDNGGDTALARILPRRNVASGTVVKLRYSCPLVAAGSPTYSFLNRTLSIRPIRVG